MSTYDRRGILKAMFALGGTVFLTGCDRLSRAGWFTGTLRQAETVNEVVQKALTKRDGMAREFTEAHISPTFRANGNRNPDSPEYRRLAANHFEDYRLRVGGLVRGPVDLSLMDIRSLPSRTQITRHDCVEGWSVIGKWKGARMSALMNLVEPLPEARYVVFHCADRWGRDRTPYYESIDMEDAYHPQTLLAYDLNDRPVPVANGAPIRIRVERQLGYKMAKYVMAIELVESFDHIGGGQGGFWEDRGYAWYAGI